MPPTPSRSPYNGTEKKLVLAFDIGTTFSGISYSILNPGHIPEIMSVTRFPAQERIGHSKIPTIIYYDQDGNVRAVGAEALLESVQEQAEDEEWVKATWFKVHMRPKSITNSSITPNFLALPPNKSIIDLFADFMKYLYKCAKTYIEQTSPLGPSLWQLLQPTIEYVLTHPNGWEGRQQQHMRQAAVLAGLISDTPLGHSRIRFVTEGEASLHFCIQNGLTIGAMEDGEGIIVVDAGGGTIDISTYGQSSETKFEEIVAAECHLQGSVFVTERARTFLSSYLKESKFLEDVERMAADFDQSGKLTFDQADTPLFIRFGGARDRDLALGIRGGQLKLPGIEVSNFFQPSITCMIDSIQAIVEGQEAKAGKQIKTVFLVGGFLLVHTFSIRLRRGSNTMDFVSADRMAACTNKAVSEGAISFYLDHSVNSRVSKLAYGTSCDILYDHSLPSHRGKLSSAFIDIDGKKWLPRGFDIILPKGTKISETQEYACGYYKTFTTRSEFRNMRSNIIAYRGSERQPKWMDNDRDQYTTLCWVETGTSQLYNAVIPCSHGGREFFKMEFELIMSFGLTELAAQIAWEENGVQKRGPAKIIYDELG